MSTMLAVMTYPGGNDALKRHWHYFKRQEADWEYVITTDNDTSEPPAGASKLPVGRDCYIEADHLPRRMLDAIERLLALPWTHLVLTEYDTVFFNRIRVEAMEHAVASHYAGGPTWGSKASGFHHNPWVFMREAAIKFLAVGRQAIEEGVCGSKTGTHLAAPEGSPDVFFTYVCEQMKQPIQDNLWKEYSRNDLKDENHLKEARMAFRNNYDVIHGIKTQHELDYVTSWTRYV